MNLVLAKPRFIPAPQIEKIVTDHLHKSGLMPTDEHPVLDIETFIEQYLQSDLDQHDVSLAQGELGVTEFRPGERPQIKINRILTEAADAARYTWEIGRWRFTMAHEAAHVMLHRVDVEAAFAQLCLFDIDQDAFRFPAFRDDATVTASYSQREYQANLAASILLMPCPVFLSVARPIIQSIETFPGEDFRTSRAFDVVVESVAEHFHVSRKATQIRLEALDLASLRSQLELTSLNQTDF